MINNVIWCIFPITQTEMSSFWQNYHYWLHLIMTTSGAAADEHFVEMTKSQKFNVVHVVWCSLYSSLLSCDIQMRYTHDMEVQYPHEIHWFIDVEISYLRFTYDEGLYWMCVNITTCWGYCNIKVDPFHTLMSPSSWGGGPIRHQSQNMSCTWVHSDDKRVYIP